MTAKGWRPVALAALFISATLALEAGWGPRFGGELRVLVPALPARVGPPDDSAPAKRLLAGLVHETLIGWGSDGQPQAGLAGSWAPAAGGREWSLRLREGALFHDGSAVTAERAAASLRRFLRSASPAAAHLASALEGGPAFARGASEELAGVGASEGELTLRFAQPRAAALATLASLGAAIVGADGAVGAGPFVPTFSLPGKRAVLRAFAEHVRGRPFLDRLQIEVAADRAERARSLKAGTSDLALEVLAPAQAWSTALLVLDTTRPPFDDPRARRAVDAVLDRPELASRWSEGGEPRFGLGFLDPPAAEAVSPGPPLVGSIVIEVASDVPLPLGRRVVALLSSLGLRVAVVAPLARANARLLRFAPEIPERALHLRELLVLAGAPADRIAALEAADAIGDAPGRSAALDAVAAGLHAERSCLALVGLPLGFAARDGVHGARFDASSRLVLEDAWRDER